MLYLNGKQRSINKNNVKYFSKQHINCSSLLVCDLFRINYKQQFKMKVKTCVDARPNT